jgi:hypothetical protein
VGSAPIRIALAVIALVAGAWLALGVRATDLESDARTLGSGTQGAPRTADEVRRARTDLRRARLLSVDREPLLSEGLLLFASGRRDEGLEIVERVAAEEPSNIDGWFALYSLYSQSNNPERAAEAARRIRALNPLAGDALPR